MIFCKLGRDGLDEPNMSLKVTSRELRRKAVMIMEYKSEPVDGDSKALHHIMGIMVPKVVRENK